MRNLNMPKKIKFKTMQDYADEEEKLINKILPKVPYLMRKVTPYDLYKQLVAYHHKLDPHTYPTKTISKKSFALRRVLCDMCELEDEYGNLVGICLYYIAKKTMVITDFIIDETVRSVGYGKQLMDKVNAIALKKKCKELILGVSAQNGHALEFYLKSGFRCAKMDMYKEL